MLGRARYARQAFQGPPSAGDFPAVSLRHKIRRVPQEPSPLTIKNDITVNIGLKLSISAQTVGGAFGRTGFVWLTGAKAYTNYEWYLQKTMIRDIFDMYQRITDFTRKRKTGFTDFWHESEIKKIEQISSLLFRGFVDYVNRRVIYDSDFRPRLDYRADTHLPAPVMPSESSASYHLPQIQEKITKEIKTEGHDVMHAAEQLNIESVMDKVYKKLSDSMRRERLQKGLR